MVFQKPGPARFCEAECYRIDPASKKVLCRSSIGTNLDGNGEFELDYDYLVIALGARPNTFNTPGVPEHCHFLKEIEDAQRIRRSVMACFEKASLPNLSEEERKKNLHFVVNRRVLATDEWLRVLGCDNVYALGDCATITQRKVMEDISEIFKVVDRENSGTLTVKEIKYVLDDIIERYPQVALYLKTKQLKDFLDLLVESEGDAAKEFIEIDIGRFKKALAQVDSQVKILPATAQVAAQEGQYLAKCFNRMKICEENPEGPLRIRGTGRHRFKPFRYRHLGQFAPLGGEQTAAQLPGDWISIGHSSQWLWYSVYASMTMNLPTS
ncbi:hypothetical protein HPP92_017059 [Vanilla planifolia]|uniref:EF-hand domain-containing protein n=1 Tax=Vanilla planifolia TaxID=51239 RepID=A0A835QJ89_VANPL|nr:hypothetical protein HPP92_017059 [Vanilla planifolia]